MTAHPPHVIISFDMETDLGNWWTTYEGVNHGTPAILEILARRAVSATFLFTAAAAQACPVAVQQVLEAGCEVGCHGLHHEFLGEANSDTPGIFTLLPEEIDHRLELATDAVAAIAGVRPVSFRCPRLQGSNQVIQALVRLGYIADSSYPTYFYAQQLGPYYPHRDDWREPGDLPLLELPLFADFTAELRDPSDPYKRERDGWPRLRLEGGERMKQRMDKMVAYLFESRSAGFLLPLSASMGIRPHAARAGLRRRPSRGGIVAVGEQRSGAPGRIWIRSSIAYAVTARHSGRCAILPLRGAVAR